MAVTPTRRNPLLGPASFAENTTGKPPTEQIGARAPHTPFDWASFLDEAEQTPDLTFPSSIRTYHVMRTDSQIDALHAGTVSPIKEFRWSIDPNGTSRKIAEAVAADLGLPLKGEEDEHTKRKGNRFSWDDFLNDALLAPMYGFFDFQVVGTNTPDDGFRMKKMVPLHPRYTEGFREDDGGELTAIKQTIAGPRLGGLGMPEPIPADYLVRFVWRAEAGSHVGRSMLRSMFREWAVKDKVLRTGAINIQRAGGVPVIEGAPGMSNPQLADLAKMARQFKVADGGGGAVPFGTKLNLVGGSVPDAISFIHYCDEAMARVWALMLVQLGMSATGNRALGAEFAIYAARAQRAWAKWIKSSVDSYFDRFTEWNDPFQTYAPLLCFEQAKPDQLSLADLVALIEAGAITVDPELEEWIRSEGGLPEKPEEEEEETTPPPVVLGPDGQPVAQPPQLGPDGKPLPTPKLPSPSVDPTVTQPTFARGGATAHPLGVEREYGGVRASLTLPPRELRRPPSANEIRAAVDFRGLDEAHASTTVALQQAWLKDVLPEQITNLGAQIRGLSEVSKVGAAGLQAPGLGGDLLLEHLTTAAVSGAKAAKREIAAQGKPAEHVRLVPDTPAALAPRVADQAAAMVKLNANAVSLAAQRKAASLVSEGGRSPAAIAAAVEDHLKGQKHVWEREQLKGAVTMAQNQGRIAAFESQPDAATAVYEASELLDDRTCEPCQAIDGTVFDSLEEASEAYAGGGYVDCEGGPNCRGTIVGVFPEQNTEGGGGRLNEPETPTTQPEPGGGVSPEMLSEPGAEGAPEAEPAGVTVEQITNAASLADAASLVSANSPVEHVTALGQRVRKAAEERLYSHPAHQAARDARNRFRVVDPEFRRVRALPSSRERRATLDRLAPEREAARREVERAQAAIPKRADVVREVLSDVRAMGGQLGTGAAGQAPTARMALFPTLMAPDAADLATTMDSALQRAASRMPADWLAASARSGLVEPVVTPEAPRGFQATFHDGDRYVTRSRIALDEAGWKTVENPVVAHELGHRMQDVVPGIARLERDFFEQRTAGEEAASLRQLTGNDGYKVDEIAKEDNFVRAYTGKTYELAPHEFLPDGRVRQAESREALPKEVVTTGIEEALYNVRRSYSDDPGLVDFTLGLLAGI